MSVEDYRVSDSEMYSRIRHRVSLITDSSFRFVCRETLDFWSSLVRPKMGVGTGETSPGVGPDNND